MQLEFADWVRTVFNHPVDSNQNTRRRYPIPNRELGLKDIEFIATLYEDPVPGLSNFSDDQVAQGLWIWRAYLPATQLGCSMIDSHGRSGDDSCARLSRYTNCSLRGDARLRLAATIRSR